MGWSRARKRDAKAYLKLAKMAGKTLVVNPVTGKILDMAKARTIGKYRRRLDKDDRLCMVCGRGRPVPPGHVHMKCAMEAIRNIQPKTVDELDRPGGRMTADTWHLGNVSARCGRCNVNWGWHECDEYAWRPMGYR